MLNYRYQGAIPFWYRLFYEKKEEIFGSYKKT